MSSGEATKRLDAKQHAAAKCSHQWSSAVIRSHQRPSGPSTVISSHQRLCSSQPSRANQASYSVIELDLEGDGAALRARLGARTGRTSVPSVWINGEYCGGLNDGPGLGPLDAEGQLDPKLRAAGAM